MRTESELSTNAKEEKRPRASVDCHAVLDLEGRFAVVNEDLATCLDIEADALVGVDLERFVDAESPRELLDDLWCKLGDGASWSSTVKLRTSAGTGLWMRLTVAPDVNRGVKKAYLAHFRPAFAAEIAHARSQFAQIARGVKIDADPRRGAGPVAWFRRVRGTSRADDLVGFALSLVGAAVAALFILSAKPDLGGWVLRSLVLGLATLAALGGIAVIVLESRQRKREYGVVCGLIDRIAQGDTDAGSVDINRVEFAALRDALRRLKLKLSFASNRDGAPNHGDWQHPEEAMSSAPMLSERLSRIETRCAELVSLSHRLAGGVPESDPGEPLVMKRLAQLPERFEPLRAKIQCLAHASRQSRVLGLNLALLEARSEVKGVNRMHRVARSVARETADGVALLEQEVDILKRELQSVTESLSLQTQHPRAVAATMCDGLTDLLGELREVRSLVDVDRHGVRTVSDVTVGLHEAAYPPVTVGNPPSERRDVKKVSRLKAVGSTPLPRVGRGKRGGPLEEDWRG